MPPIRGFSVDVLLDPHLRAGPVRRAHRRSIWGTSGLAAAEPDWWRLRTMRLAKAERGPVARRARSCRSSARLYQHWRLVRDRCGSTSGGLWAPCPLDGQAIVRRFGAILGAGGKTRSSQKADEDRRDDFPERFDMCIPR